MCAGLAPRSTCPELSEGKTYCPLTGGIHSGHTRLRSDTETRSERVAKAMRQAGAAASGMARAAARTVWTMMGGRHVEETAEKSGPPRAGDHGEPGEAATGDG